MSLLRKMSVGSTGLGWVVVIAAKLVPVNRYDVLGEGRVGFDCESPLFVGVLVGAAAALLSFGVIACGLALRGTRTGRVVLAIGVLGLLLLATTVPSVREEWRRNHEPLSPCL